MVVTIGLGRLLDHDACYHLPFRRARADFNASRVMCARIAALARRARSASGSVRSGSTSSRNRRQNPSRAGPVYTLGSRLAARA